MARRTLSDAEIRAQIPAARARAEQPRPLRVREARYDPATGRIVLELTNGCWFGFPPELAEGLRGADPADLADVQATLDGEALRWERLDADLLVAPLLEGVLGSRAWMRDIARELGRRGGRVTSEAKAAAARRNGRKGGRPPT